MKTNDTEIKTTNTENLRPVSAKGKVLRFLELRIQGHSLGTISQVLGVPKSTLFGWHRRHRETIHRLQRIELEAIEERIVGSQQDQFTAMGRMLDCLERALAAKINEHAHELSINTLFWMAANLRDHFGRLRKCVAFADFPDSQRPSGRTRTIPHENPPPTPK